MTMRKLLESLDQIFAGTPEQKPGDQVRGVEKPKSKGKFLGKPYKRNDEPESGEHPFHDRLVGEGDDNEEDKDDELTEALKAQFEDYVKNKAVPDTKKSLKLSKDGESYVVKNEKGETVCSGTKTDCQDHIAKKNSALNDAKLDEDERIGKDNIIPGDELERRPGSWRGTQMKRMTAKGKPTQAERGMQNMTKQHIQMTNKKGGLTGPKGKLPEAKGGVDERIEAHGIRGMDRKPWQKIFKNVAALESWCDKFDAEVYGTRDVDAGSHRNLMPAMRPKDYKMNEADEVTSKTAKFAKFAELLVKLQGQLKQTRQQIQAKGKGTVDEDTPPPAGVQTTMPPQPGAPVQTANPVKIGQAPAPGQSAAPVAAPAAQTKPAPGQPQVPSQQAPAPAGTPTATTPPGQPPAPVAGAPGGAPVAPPPGTPTPAVGGQVNAATTPGEQVKGLVQTLASNPAAAKQLGTKLSTIR